MRLVTPIAAKLEFQEMYRLTPGMAKKDSDLETIQEPPGLPKRAHLGMLVILQIVMATELVLLVTEERWMHAFLVIGVMAACLGPVIARKKMLVEIPAEIQILAVLFVFAALFLGEVQDYYGRIWWWDLALHGTAGLLLGLLGFMIVYILNENALVDLHMRPSFVALFAFLFGLGIGTLWEIFEFGMDQIFGFNMQKPMLGDPSGLTDTMWDLIVNALGAGLMSLVGWRYFKRSRRTGVDGWVTRFIERNPRLFGR